MREMEEFPDRVKFRLFVDDECESPLILVTEPLGREISVGPGEWVDVASETGDGTPSEIWVRADGSLAVYGRLVVVTDRDGVERLY